MMFGNIIYNLSLVLMILNRTFTLFQVPALNYLMELDPTHVCKVVDCDAAEWGIMNGWPYSFADHHSNICFEDCELTWPVYDEALGG